MESDESANSNGMQSEDSDEKSEKLLDEVRSDFVRDNQVFALNTVESLADTDRLTTKSE